MRTPSTPDTEAIQARIADLEAEQAALPEQEQAALSAGDADTLARMHARRQILAHQLDLAHQSLADATRQAIDDEVARVNTALLETVGKASEYDFAASVYQHMASECRSKEEHLNWRLVRLLEQRPAGGRR